MPKYVSGPGAMGNEINPSKPIYFPSASRTDKMILRLFGYRVREDGRLVKRDS
jgi:hypothetical protein